MPGGRAPWRSSQKGDRLPRDTTLLEYIDHLLIYTDSCSSFTGQVCGWPLARAGAFASLGRGERPAAPTPAAYRCCMGNCPGAPVSGWNTILIRSLSREKPLLVYLSSVCHHRSLQEEGRYLSSPRCKILNDELCHFFGFFHCQKMASVRDSYQRTLEDPLGHAFGNHRE
jgi:hypothetical protein